MHTFLHQAFLLKHLNRSGWLRIGIDKPESVAAHSWGVALLCIHLAPENLDLQKLITLAIIHDLPEVIVGDITPHDNVSKETKKRLEHNAAKELFPQDIFALWKEAQEKLTPEAKFIHLMDKLDMAIQAKQYENLGDTSEFIESAKKTLHSLSVPQDLRAKFDEIMR